MAGPLFTTPPPAPSATSGAATYAADADTFFAWLEGDFHSQLTAAALAWGAGQPYCTVGGTANALTLTSGLSLTSLTTGQRVIFTPPSANTSTVTLNLDGRGDTAAKTITGAAMPAGYLIAGQPTSAIYTGSEFRVSRDPESGGTVNVSSGSWTRLADGTQWCEVILDDTAGPWTTSRGGGAFFMRTSGITWTYAKPFTAAPVVKPDPERAADLVMGCSQRTPTTTSVTLNPWADTSLASGTSKTIHVTAKGRWY